MTKADIVAKISEKLGMEKGDVQATVESFMNEVKSSLQTGTVEVYLDNVGVYGVGNHGIHISDCSLVDECGAGSGGGACRRSR